MDEDIAAGGFRIATTSDGGAYKNNIYCLSNSLSVFGADLGFGQGYEITAVRFVGRRLYLVLFKQGLSPYAVVTLANYYSPQFLGIFSLSGFSSYLHPYDENTLIAIGK